MLIRSLTFAVIMSGPIASAVQSQQAAACTTTWSRPRQITIGSAYVNIETPQIVHTHAGIALFGDNAFAVTPTDSGFMPVVGRPRSEHMIAGMLLRPDGATVPIPAPAGIRSFIDVRAAGEGGIAHVLWGSSADTSSMQFRHVNALWYARFDGTAWTRPELVLADSTLLWRHQLNSFVVADGRAHLTVLREDGPGIPEVLHVVRGPTGPSSVRRTGFRALYTDLIVDPRGPLWLATIASDRSDRAKVLIRRSDDGGQSWDKPVDLYRSGLGTAYDAKIIATPSGRLYAAWIVEPRSDVTGRADRILLATSNDRGTNWHPLPMITAVPDVRDLRLLPEGRDAAQIAFHTDEADGQVVWTRIDSAQSNPRVAFGPTWFAANLAAPTPDTLYLAWPEWRVAGPERIPALMLSRRRSCLESSAVP